MLFAGNDRPAGLQRSLRIPQRSRASPYPFVERNDQEQMPNQLAEGIHHSMYVLPKRVERNS